MVRDSPREVVRLVRLLCLELLGNSQPAKERSKKMEEEKKGEETAEWVRAKGKEVPGNP